MPADGGEGLMADDERRAEIEAFLRGTLAKTGWSDPMINGLLTDLQPYLDRVCDARGDDEQTWGIFVCPRCGTRVNSGGEDPPACGMHFPERVEAEYVEVSRVSSPVRDARDDEKVRAENERLRELYANQAAIEARGWTIDHLMECEEALRMAEARVAELEATARSPQDEDHDG